MSGILEISALLWIILTNLITFAVLGMAGVYAWERYSRGKERLQ